MARDQRLRLGVVVQHIVVIQTLIEVMLWRTRRSILIQLVLLLQLLSTGCNHITVGYDFCVTICQLRATLELGECHAICKCQTAHARCQFDHIGGRARRTDRFKLLEYFFVLHDFIAEILLDCLDIGPLCLTQQRLFLGLLHHRHLDYIRWER